ncbi:MAG TPA: ankyrin repeat domain-containing protein [Blastocatellia bacterium]|nr:ankyrin repeat domain-containing protein [Blastocatellia bacterium]
MLWKLKPDITLKTEEGVTALMIAVNRDQIEVVQALLGLGADPTVQDIYGRTPLTFAETYNMQGIANLLKKYGAKK